MLALLLALAAAEPGAPQPDEAPIAIAETAASAEALVDGAVARIRAGDYPGARILLDEALDRDRADVDAIAYLRGASFELEGEIAQAIALYELGLTEWPTSPLADDRRFRLAESLATLGQPREALRLLRTLEVSTAEDRAKLDLVTAIATLADGRDRPGRRLVATALDGLPPETAAFYQAKARIAYARSLADEAAGLSLTGGERRQVRRLEARAALVATIEQQVTAAARLDEPEWVLAGLLLLGEAYAGVAEALLAAPPPRRLSEEQAAIYAELVGERAVILLTKATQAHGAGLDLAERIGWQSRRVGELERARAALVARVEALDR